MLSVKWCRKMANGEIHLTKLGERSLMDFCSKVDFSAEGIVLDGIKIREEWLAPD